MVNVVYGLNLDEGLVRKSNRIQNAQENFAREQIVLELKEEHSKRYLIKNGLVTPEEYRKYNGKSLQRIGLERVASATAIMNNSVG
ncbi:Uncharacterised protein [uncultured archaeon]|nr:Uncharacterised protein [uncultured archaeon]